MPKALKEQGPDFSKILLRTYEKLMQKSWPKKNLGWACDYQNRHKNLIMKNLGQSYVKLTHTSYA